MELFLGTSIVDNIEERIWQKALVNCVINPLTAFYRCTNGELFINSERKEKVHALCEELANIIKQTQCPISTTTAQIISDTKTIALLTEKNTSSMLTDLKNGRTLELEHLNRYFIRRAEQYAVPCPINLDLVNTLTKARQVINSFIPVIKRQKKPAMYMRVFLITIGFLYVVTSFIVRNDVKALRFFIFVNANTTS